MGDPTIAIREASPDDAARLGELCRHSFAMAPEWQAPRFMVTRWWRRLLNSEGCAVFVAETQDRTIAGFAVDAGDEKDWDRLNSQGPHHKACKILVACLRPSILKSRFRKRRKARLAGARCQDGSSSQLTDSSAWRDAAESVMLLVVDPTIRRSGAGSALLEVVDQRIVARGNPLLRVHLDPRNDRARAFYERHGYEFVGRDGSSAIMTKTHDGAGGDP